MIAGGMDFLPPTGAYAPDDSSPYLSGAEEGIGGVWMSGQVPSPTDSKASVDSGVSESLSDTQLLAELFPSDFLLSAEQAAASPTSSSGLSPPPPFLSAQPNMMTMSAQTKDRKARTKCAEMARQNRIKKKAYVEGLEKDHAVLKAENLVYKTKCTELKASVRKLDKEVKYLRSVLANQSVLASLIANIPDVKEVHLTSSLLQKRPREETGNSHPPPAKKGKKTTGGVCLHVSDDVVSLEFCATCSQQAADSAP